MLREVIISGVIVAICIVIKFLINSMIHRTAKKGKTKEHAVKLVKRIVNISLIILGIFSLTFVWGLNFQNIWVFLTSLLALIAVGFIAVWSMLSNILAGVIIFFTRALKAGDTVRITPEKVVGKVIRVGVVFVVLKDPKGGYIKIPNNMIFQRIITVSRPK